MEFGAWIMLIVVVGGVFGGFIYTSRLFLSKKLSRELLEKDKDREAT